MRDYHTLTSMGKLRRLHKLASRMVGTHYFEDFTLRFLCYETNLIYLVRNGAGERMILRLATPGWRTKENLVNESLWLEALSEGGEFTVPRPILSRRGERVVTLTMDGIPGTWNGSLFTYLPGRPLEHSLTPGNGVKLGALTAQLHVQGKEWIRPIEFTEQKFDSYLSRGEEEVLFSCEVLASLPKEDREMLYTVRDRVAREYDSFDREDLRVIHCDLWHGNVKIDRGELCPFDFEDTILGFPLHDIAMALLDIKEEVPRDYPKLRDSYRRGYESIRPWPQGSLETLMAGRVLWQLNWISRFKPDKLSGALRRRREDLMLLCE
ncbi:MAG: phosphotransferase [Spirochaetales bacterium]|nr:phosphotransferase [Spirochaetales bacterium]